MLRPPTPPCERQTEARAWLPGRNVADLAKLLEEALEIVARDPDPGIAHDD